MCSAAPPSITTLPNKNEKLGFRRLVMDRERAYVTMELARVRDALMGSDALIARAKANPSPTMLNDVFMSDIEELWQLFQPFTRYVSDAAWACSALRWAGHLPSLVPFAPEQPVLACGCEGHANQENVIGVLKSTHKPDWQAFLDYAEQERAEGRILAKSALELRTQLLLALEKLNSRFLKGISAQLVKLDFPYNDMGLLDGEADFYHLLSQVEPLPAALAKGLDAVDPCDYSIDQLEELRIRGKALRESIARMRREQGNAFYTKAASLTGAAQREAHGKADYRWLLLIRDGGIECARARANIAALYLDQKNFQLAIKMAGLAAHETYYIIEEPKHWLIFRSSSVKAFASGEAPVLDESDMRFLTDAQYADCRKLCWKAKIRQGKAHIGLCLAALSGRGTMTEQDVEIARINRDEAIKCYKEAGNRLSPPVPMEDIKLLQQTYCKRLEEHVRARKSLGR